MGWIIVLCIPAGLLAIIGLLLLLRVNLTIEYNGELKGWLRILFIRIPLFPRKWKIKDHLPEKQKKKNKKAQKKNASKEKASSKKGEPKKKKSFRENFRFFTELVKAVVVPSAKRLGKHLTVYISVLRIQLATEEAGKTAVLYGTTVSLATAFLEFLRGICNLKMGKEKNIYIEPRYDAEKTEFQAKITVSLRLWHAVHIALPALFGYLKITSKASEQNSENTDQTAEVQRKSAEN